VAKQHINIGKTANDKSGDPLRVAFDKINLNFTELYTTSVNNTSAILIVGQDALIRDNLSVRVINNNNALDIQLKYQKSNFNVYVSAYRTYPTTANIYSGKILKTEDNTTWDTVGSLLTAGDTIGITFTDHSLFNVYKVTVTADTIPPGDGTIGKALCTIEKL